MPPEPPKALPVTENCIGPAQQPAKLTPERTPGSVERLKLVSFSCTAISRNGLTA